MDIEVVITSLAHGGDGVGRVEGQVCFVPYALPGDTVRATVVRRTRKALWARLVEVLVRSPHRTAPSCPVFGECGGCGWLHFPYPAQGEWKRRVVADCLARIGGVEASVEWAGDPDPALGYRTRATFHGDGAGWGFYARQSHEVVPISGCPLCHPRLNAAFEQLHETPWTGSVEIAVNPEGGEVLAWSRDPLPEAMARRFPEAGAPGADASRSRFVFDGVPIVNGAFSQSSLLLNRRLREIVRAFAGRPRRVLDLYCGTGNFSLLFTDHGEVTGIDGDAVAIDAARSTGVGRFLRGGPGRMAKLLRNEAWDLVVLDPPRAGAKELQEALARAKTEAIVYVSCDPATQARDIAALSAGGWLVDRVMAVDLFPQTAHVEAVCRLIRPH